MIDVRYQSIVRATSENERASKLYEKLIENGHGYEYIKVAFNFNKFLLIQKNTQHEINKLLSKEEYAELPDTHIENIIYISKSIINEGVNGYAGSIERVNTTSNNQQKTKTTVQNIQFSKFDKKSSELISTKALDIMFSILCMTLKLIYLMAIVTDLSTYYRQYQITTMHLQLLNIFQKCQNLTN